MPTLHLAPHGWLTIHPPLDHISDAEAIARWSAELAAVADDEAVGS